MQMCSECEKLKDQVELLQLQLGLDKTFHAPRSWGLTNQEEKLLGVIYNRRGMVASKASILIAMYSDRADDEPDQKIIDVWICKIRAKLRKHAPNVEIQTIWGRGYLMDKASRDVLTALVEGELAEV